MKIKFLICISVEVVVLLIDSEVTPDGSQKVDSVGVGSKKKEEKGKGEGETEEEGVIPPGQEETGISEEGAVPPGQEETGVSVDPGAEEPMGADGGN